MLNSPRKSLLSSLVSLHLSSRTPFFRQFSHFHQASCLSMALIVHGPLYSTSTQRILLTLAELDVDDYKLVHVDVLKGQHKSPEFLKLQPFGQIPILQDGDFTIFGSRAVARYLAEKYDGSALLGKTTKERAVVNQWWEVESQNFYQPVSTILFQKVFTPVFGLVYNDAMVAKQMAKVEKVLDVYEAHLSTSKYLAGDSFTMADLSHIPDANLLVTAAGKSELFSSRPHVSAWWNEISSRPTFQKVLALLNQSLKRAEFLL